MTNDLLRNWKDNELIEISGIDWFWTDKAILEIPSWVRKILCGVANEKPQWVFVASLLEDELKKEGFSKKGYVLVR